LSRRRQVSIEALATLPSAKPDKEPKERNERQSEAYRPSTTMDEAVHHMAANVHGQEADHDNTKSVPDDGERKDKRDEKQSTSG
jgi:hypothetical protein